MHQQAERTVAPRVETRGVQRALQLALSITTAETEDEVFRRTLAAACDLTGADIGLAVRGNGPTFRHGNAALSRRLEAVAACADRSGCPTSQYAMIGLPSAIALPLREATVIIAARTPNRLGPAAVPLLSLLVAHADTGLERLREIAVLARRANSDPLTGLRHYRPFEERLEASQPGRTAVIAVDVDEFKRINDEYGHQAGDRALLELVDALRSALRGDDHIYRIGGDEFAVVIDVAAAAEVSNIVRRLLDAARVAGHPISVGAAMRLDGETGRETLLRADKALYQAKREGRNTARLAA